MSDDESSPSLRDSGELSKRFLQLEDQLDLFDIQAQGVPVWEQIRFNVHQEVLQKSGDAKLSSRDLDRNSFRSYLKGLSLWAKHGIWRNALLADEHDILFFGHQRRKRLEDGYWWDIYCDPITEAGDLDYLHVERPQNLGHKQPAKTGNLCYLDFIEYAGTLKSKLGLVDAGLSDATREELRSAERALENEFNADIDVLGRAESKFIWQNSTKPLYNKFLERLNPDIAVIVVSYKKEQFIEACQNSGIPVVELQHGVIHPDHLGYSYPGDRSKETFPDYLLTWGEHWNDAVEYPIPDDRVISVGYPYLEQRRDEYVGVEQHEQLLFISQGTIGEQLSKFAVQAARHPNIDHDVVYKLHPGEGDRWREEYPRLEDAPLDVVDETGKPLYRLFAESTAQIGVGSTAVYEGLCFNLETYVLELSGSRILRPLVDAGIATTVSDVEELSHSLGSHPGRGVEDLGVFEYDAVEKTQRALERISATR